MREKSFLNKKHEKLIDIEVKIPNLEDMSYLYTGEYGIMDFRANAEYSLMEAIEVISKNTRYENICNSIIKKCQDIFEDNE